VSAGSIPATLYIFVTSRDSSIVIPGRIVGVARASSVFPAPGGPTITTLCPPAAATSSARFTCSWPLMCWKSTPSGASPGGNDLYPLCAKGAIGSSACRCAASLPSDSTGTTSKPSTNDASSASGSGTYTLWNPRSRASPTIGRIPCVCLSRPSSDNSPRNRARSNVSGTCPDAMSMPTAIGRS